MALTGRFKVLETDTENKHAIIELDGDMDYSIYAAFKKTINSLLASGINHITYDLAKLTYIQSLGLGIIMWSFVELENKNGKITIRGANDHIKEVFKAAQLDNLVDLL